MLDQPDNGGIAMNYHELRSSRIQQLSWGHMEIEGIGVGKEFKLWPGGGRRRYWRETDTHHIPGVQPSDVTELLDKASQTIVLSRGMLLMLRTCRETLGLLEERGITVHVAETKEAAKIYNQLASQGQAVGDLFHSTC